MRFPAMLLDAQRAQSIKVQIMMGRVQELVVSWR